MRSNRPSVATAARKSHARALHAQTRKLARAWDADRAICDRLQLQTVDVQFCETLRNDAIEST
eukprot:4864612-Lingulodinium_polyedra.AAC.1